MNLNNAVFVSITCLLCDMSKCHSDIVLEQNFQDELMSVCARKAEDVTGFSDLASQQDQREASNAAWYTQRDQQFSVLADPEIPFEEVSGGNTKFLGRSVEGIPFEFLVYYLDLSSLHPVNRELYPKSTGFRELDQLLDMRRTGHMSRYHYTGSFLDTSEHVVCSLLNQDTNAVVHGVQPVVRLILEVNPRAILETKLDDFPIRSESCDIAVPSQLLANPHLTNTVLVAGNELGSKFDAHHAIRVAGVLLQKNNLKGAGIPQRHMWQAFDRFCRQSGVPILFDSEPNEVNLSDN